MGNGRNFIRKQRKSEQQPAIVQIALPDVSTLSSYHCPQCMNNVFEPAYRIWEISALVSPTGLAQPAEQKVWRCIGCGFAFDLATLKKLDPIERQELVESIRQQQKK